MLPSVQTIVGYGPSGGITPLAYFFFLAQKSLLLERDHLALEAIEDFDKLVSHQLVLFDELEWRGVLFELYGLDVRRV